MAIQAKIILDSVSPLGIRLTTMELTYWLMVHNELLTHRTMWKTDSMQFEEWLDASRNSSSNRALPPAKVRDQVANDPYIPTFLAPTKGMIGGDEVIDQYNARTVWVWARDQALKAFDMFEKGVRVHKQHRNRLLAPFQYITTVLTANEEWWEHFFTLRDHPAAQPDIAIVAKMAHEAYETSYADILGFGDWHLPYVTFDDMVVLAEEDVRAHNDPYYTARKLSVARCARASFLRQGEVVEVRDDLRLYDDLTTSVPPHHSPLEHVCTPMDKDQKLGNLHGWIQLRHYVK
jgi:hypothetical protein